MKPPFRIDMAAYANLMEGINRQHLTERKGNLADFHLYHDDTWLSDTAVIDIVHRHKGEWAVDLLFAYTHNPLQFIRRNITSHSCPKRASQKAELMRRLAAKDQRGTLWVTLNTLIISNN